MLSFASLFRRAGALAGAVCCAAALPLAAVAAVPLTLSSPDGTLRGEFATDASGALVWSLSRFNQPLLDPARVGVTVDGVDLGADVSLGEAERGALDETYPLHGGKAQAVNRARTLRVPVRNRAGALAFTLEARAYDDGFAWRAIVPGAEGQTRRVNGEASSWKLPLRSRVWFFERPNDWKLKSYAGEWMSTPVENLPKVSKVGPVQGTPLVVELAEQSGYLLLSEAALANYSGLRLRALPEGRVVQADFTEGEKGFEVRGEIVTPWRATIAVRTLDQLVNSTLIPNLCPPPDVRLYADPSYIKPGRSVWRWWSAGTGTPAEERAFVDYAVELGFEYTIVDDGWKDWPDAWNEIRAITAYARERRVGVLLWKDYKDVASSADDWAQLRGFLDEVAAAGAAGVKLDFLNAESKDRVDFTLAALRLAAERRLLVNFHGVTKSTGEARTFPNEITREGIRGVELNKMREGPIPAWHNAALPYTRFVVGAGDYTPLAYSRPGPTTWAHQLATVVQFLSPLQCIAEHPEMLLRDPATQPALDVLKAIPATWDETRVLAPSVLGQLSVIARRSGGTWFLSVLNGDEPVRLERLDLSFLGDGRYRAVELTSPERTGFVRREVEAVTAQTQWSLALAAGDGAVVQFLPAAPAVVEAQPRTGVPNFHAKATAGGAVRVAYLGGSITAENGWRIGTRAFNQQRYPQAKVEEIFAAVSGTGSPLGVARLQRDVLAHRPDLLFVEFAVNDGGLDPARIERAMEGIVRQTWAQFPECDIIFVYTIARGMLPDYTAGRMNRSATAMERVAAHYGIPSIAFGFEVARRVAAGEWVFSADKSVGLKDAEGRGVFSHDGTHPNELGHELYTEIVARHWPAIAQAARPAPHEPGAALRADNWGRAGIKPVGELQASADWTELARDDKRITFHAGRLAPPTWRSATAGATVEGIVHGSVIGVLGYKNEKSSLFRVYVDDLPPVEGSFRDQPLGPQYRLKSWFDARTHAPGPHRVRVEQISGAADDRELLLSGLLFSGDDSTP